MKNGRHHGLKFEKFKELQEFVLATANLPMGLKTFKSCGSRSCGTTGTFL